MDRSLIAALMSGLIFPGAGQIYLKRHLRGLCFIVPALAGAAYFVKQVLARAMPLVEQVMNGTLAPDPLRIAAELERQGSAAGTATDLAAALMLACWIASIIDAWLLGRRISPPAAKSPSPARPKGLP